MLVQANSELGLLFEFADHTKKALIVAGCELGINLRMLSQIVGLDDSTVSRRYDAARRSIFDNEEAGKIIGRVVRKHRGKR